MAPRPTPPPPRPPWALLASALVVGPFIYLYTQQWGRFIAFTFATVIAFFGSLMAAMMLSLGPEELEAIANQDPAGLAKAGGKLFAWMLVGVGAVQLAILLDLWWQGQAPKP